jgi:hypothetical protein
MSRYRLLPTAAQEVVLRDHCGQARFVWNLSVETARGFACNADVDAARNIAAGHAVTARGRSGSPGRGNREPQLLPQSAQ